MSAVAVALIVFGATFGGALVGLALRGMLPEHHLSSETRDVVKITMGLVGTMAALVLGLLVASAKSSYDAQSAELTQMSANVVLVDRAMAHYGPETKEVRSTLRETVARLAERVQPSGADAAGSPGLPSDSSEVVLERLQALTPHDDRQRELKAQATGLLMSIGQTRWLMYQQGTASASRPLITAIVFWLTIIFISWGLYARANTTVIVALAVSAMAVSSALFLIMEMYSPYQGLIRISAAPLRAALTVLGH